VKDNSTLLSKYTHTHSHMSTCA